MLIPFFDHVPKDRSDPGGDIGGPEGAGSMEGLSPHDIAPEIPSGRIVVERDLREIEEESEPLPVPGETLHRFYGRGRKALVKVFFGLLLHEGKIRPKSIEVIDPVFRLFPETIDLSDSADPGGDPGSHAGMFGEDSDMGPEEGENESEDSFHSILVAEERNFHLWVRNFLYSLGVGLKRNFSGFQVNQWCPFFPIGFFHFRHDLSGFNQIGKDRIAFPSGQRLSLSGQFVARDAVSDKTNNHLDMPLLHIVGNMPFHLSDNRLRGPSHDRGCPAEGFHADGPISHRGRMNESKLDRVLGLPVVHRAHHIRRCALGLQKKIEFINLFIDVKIEGHHERIILPVGT